MIGVRGDGNRWGISFYIIVVNSLSGLSFCSCKSPGDSFRFFCCKLVGELSFCSCIRSGISFTLLLQISLSRVTVRSCKASGISHVVSCAFFWGVCVDVNPPCVC
jgi:hypothetical protein